MQENKVTDIAPEDLDRLGLLIELATNSQLADLWLILHLFIPV